MEKTAEELVKLVRGFIQNYNQTPWRDGFEADEEFDAGTSTILSFLNLAQTDLLETGYAKCIFRYQMEAGRREYAADPWMAQIAEITYKGIPLDRTTTGQLDRDNRNWRSQASGLPQKWYMVADQIGLHPKPSVSDPNDDQLYSLVIRADSEVSELALPDDKPKRLPARYHQLLAIGAAYKISFTDVENEAAMRRIGFLKADWERGKQKLLEVVQQRDLDQFDQVPMSEYRDQWRY